LVVHHFGCPTSKVAKGLYVEKYPRPSGAIKKISADVIWGKKYEKGGEKGKC
jgi:hypothetical protein